MLRTEKPTFIGPGIKEVPALNVHSQCKERRVIVLNILNDNCLENGFRVNYVAQHPLQWRRLTQHYRDRDNGPIGAFSLIAHISVSRGTLYPQERTM